MISLDNLDFNTTTMVRILLFVCVVIQNVFLVLSETNSSSKASSEEKIHRLESQIQNLTNQVTDERTAKVDMEKKFRDTIDTMQNQILSLQTILNTMREKEIYKERPMSHYVKASKKSIMFSATLSNAKSGFNQKTIPFDKIITKVGAGYNNKTGIFTTPVSGQYLFAWQLTTYSVSVCSTYLSKNGQRVQRMDGIGGQGSQTDLTSSSTIIVDLKKGDRVEVKTYQCSYIMGDDGTSFVGWKII